MHHPLQQLVASIRRKVRRMLLLRGVSSVLLTVLLSLMVFGWLDAFLRSEAFPLRLAMSLLVLGVVVQSAYRFLWQPLAARLSDVAIAQHVQRRFPVLGDRLASSMEFLSQDEEDRLAGSAAMRRAVIIEAMGATRDLPWEQTVETRPAVRMLGFAIIAGTIGAVIVLVHPQASSLALARLANPWNERQWPRRHVLEFVEAPTRVAAGELFEVELRDTRGELPEQVWIDYRLSGSDGQAERVVTEPMQFADGVMIAHRDNVRNSFSYRARGGDDQSMDWIDLQVVEPPRIESFALRVSPPDYSGWPVLETDGRVTALVGSTVRLQGRTNKPIRAAVLHWPGPEEQQPFAAAVSQDGLRFSLRDAPQVEHSGSYWIELVDKDGVRGVQDRWPIRAVADDPPSVAVEQPATELFVTGEADVPMRIVAGDQLAIRSVGLQYLRSDQSDRGRQTIDLYQGPDQVAPVRIESIGQLAGGAPLNTQEIDYTWRLSELGLPPGAQITFNAIASDYLPQEAATPVQRINIITASELEDRIARRQSFVMGELARILKLVVEARGRVSELEIQLLEVGRLERQDVDQLQGLELMHRDIRRSLVSETEGVKHHIQSLLTELESNKVDSPEIARRVRQLDEVIDRLEAGPLDDVSRRFNDAIKSAQAADRQRSDNTEDDGNAADKRAQQAIRAAGRGQDEIIAALEDQLGDLERLNNYRQFARDLSALQRDSEAIRRDTEAIRGRTLSKDLNDLTPQERADLEKLAQKQLDAARELDKLSDRMLRTADKLGESDPLAASSIRDAVDHARRQDVAGRMRSSARGLQRNQVGQSLTEQQAAAEALEEMLGILSNRRENELDRLVGKLKEAESHLAGLRQRQQGLRKKFEEAEQLADEEERRRDLQRLAREQKQLQEEIERLGRQLQRLQANRAGDSLAQAGGSAGGASDAGEQGDAAGAVTGARQTERDLEQAEAELSQARRQAEQDLAAERLLRMQDTLVGLVKRQQGLLTEAQRLDGLRGAQGRLTRGQLASVTDLARGQDQLAEETEINGDKLASAEVFQFAMRRAAEQMRLAVDALNRLETGGDVQRAQRLAMNQLRLLIESLTDEPAENGDQQPAGGGDGPGGGQSPDGQDGFQALAAIKLLKLMQQDINARTEELRDKQQGGEPLSLGDAEELQRLVADQGRLAEIAFELLTSAAQADPEHDPDGLPNFDGDEAPPEALDDLLPQIQPQQ
jgi:hypothetical protein